MPSKVSNKRRLRRVEKRILRVFPERTSLTPTDNLAVIGAPGPVGLPWFNEIHISCTFTWHIEECQRLKSVWSKRFPRHSIFLGGPAYQNRGGSFIPGRYVRFGISISSRGCPNNCDFCFVPKREGKLRLLPICPGNEINDNNATAWPRYHWSMLIAMLQSQTRIRFQGGLEAARFKDWHRDSFQKLEPSSIHEIWFAADTDSALRPLAKVADKMFPMFAHYKDKGRRKLRCYVLIGRESFAKTEARLERVWELGFLPFAQLFQKDGKSRTKYSDKWRKLERKWARPAAMFACHKGKA